MMSERGHTPGEAASEQAELRPERLGPPSAPSRRSAELRPEGLGQALVAEEPGEPLSAEQVREQLKAHAEWELAPDGSALRRSRRFPTIRAAAAYVALVAELGEAYGYLPDIDLCNLEVTLRVDTNDNGGLTALDFEMARMLADG